MAKALDLILQALNATIQPNEPMDYVDDGLLDARQHFLSLLDGRLESYPDTQDIIDRYQERPDVWEGVIVEAINQLKLTEDKELLEAARRVIRFSDMPGEADNLG
jgi:lipopolysaccharide biosynthesis regulator YciM